MRYLPQSIAIQSSGAAEFTDYVAYLAATNYSSMLQEDVTLIKCHLCFSIYYVVVYLGTMITIRIPCFSGVSPSRQAANFSSTSSPSDETSAATAAAAAAQAGLQDLRNFLERSSSALGTRLDEGLTSFGARLNILEHRQSLASGGASEIGITTTVADFDADSLSGASLRSGTQIGDDLTLARSDLESVAERVAVLEATTAEREQSASEIASTAAEAARTEAEVKTHMTRRG